MKIKPHISASAFLVNESRARKVDLSQDIYAKCWVTPETQELWAAFAKQVYPHDDLELSLRNRYFLDHLKTRVTAHSDFVFVNLGAGFTSYPFLLDAPCRCLEVDYPHVLAFKQEQIQKWQEVGTLPRRIIEFFAADLNTERDLSALTQTLRSWTTNTPSFILLEGISYYLTQSTLDRLFAIFRAIQAPGSIVGFDFWKPSIEQNSVFRRLQQFWEERFGYSTSTYNFIDDASIQAITGYKVLEITNAAALEKVYCTTTALQESDQMLPENYALLQRLDTSS